MHGLDKLRKHYNDIAQDYLKYALIDQEVAKRMLSRFEYFKINPSRILDLAAGTGHLSLSLPYPKAQVISLDVSTQMLLQMQKKIHWWRPYNAVCADVQQLPFPSEYFDLLILNATFWHEINLAAVLQEAHRVLRPDGLLMLSSFGPDSLPEVEERSAFIDMHDIGDALSTHGFIDVVIDRQDISLRYPNLEQYQASLSMHFLSLSSEPKQDYTLEYEVLFAHAWRGRRAANVISVQELLKNR